MESQPEEATAASPKPGLIVSEDWLAVLLGSAVLLLTLVTSATNRAPDFSERLRAIDQGREHLKELDSVKSVAGDDSDREAIKSEEKRLQDLTAGLFKNPLKAVIGQVGEWKSNPANAFVNKEKLSILPGLLGVLIATLILFGVGSALRGEPIVPFVRAFVVVFLLATAAYVLAGQEVIKYYNLEYALWAILIGMVISNTVGKRRISYCRRFARSVFIKTGLVLLGAETLMSHLVALGLPGIFVSWVVTPIVLISSYVFGQYVLKMLSKSLNNDGDSRPICRCAGFRRLSPPRLPVGPRKKNCRWPSASRWRLRRS